MSRATWLADVLRAEGLHVIELSGWKVRESKSGFTPRGLVWHHTATPKTVSDISVRNLLRDGRSDLNGPLCQLGLERDGTFVCIAAGRANHNGYGLWGNDSFGIEAYNDGVGEPWAPAQLDAYIRGSAAICRHMGWDPIVTVKAHRETDPNRKIDPKGIAMDDARRKVKAALNPAPGPDPQETLMTYYYVAETKRSYCVRPWGVVRLTDDERYELAKGGAHFITIENNETWNKVAGGAP